MKAFQFNSIEKRTLFGLSSIYALRMLGLFLLYPVFSLYAHELAGGHGPMLAALALGAYPLAQALLHIPMGMLSDRFGRKRIIVLGLLLLAIGGIICALAKDIEWLIIGRLIQGSGAISAAITALLADLTEEEHRTAAMAVIGMTIALSFAAAIVASPFLYGSIGMAAIFLFMVLASLLAIPILRYLVPNPIHSTFHADTETKLSTLRTIFKNRELWRLDFGILTLHASQMALFYVLPFELKDRFHLDIQAHTWVYLGAAVLSFVCMIPCIAIAESKDRLKAFFIGSVMVIALSFALLAEPLQLVWVCLGLFLFLTAFNVLEASLPSLVSKIAPVSAKGSAMGVYATSQSLGIFLGAMVAGFLHGHFGLSAVYLCFALWALLWFLIALSMKNPPAVRTCLYGIGALSMDAAQKLTQELSRLTGVYEATILNEDGVAMLKVDRHRFNEQEAKQLIEDYTHGSIG